MNKVFLILSLFLFVTSSSAAIYKGQKVYIKKCSQCHKDEQGFVASKTKKGWKSLINKSGQPLADEHIKDEKAKDSWEYFKNKRYKKDSKHLRQFLMEYAKDSGKVPACN